MRSETQLNRGNLGFLMAKALQRWNELLRRRFAEEGFREVRPQYGSVLIPLYEEDGLPMGELGRRARLSKQTMTTMIRQMERDRLVTRRPDAKDGRVSRVMLTRRAEAFRTVAERVLGDLDRALQRRLGGASRSAAQTFLRTVAELEL